MRDGPHFVFEEVGTHALARFAPDGSLKMDFEADTRRLLCEIAYLGCVTNQSARAQRILSGLASHAPDAREVVIGEAMVSLTEGRPDGAADRLRPLSESGDPHGTAFLALALKMAGRSAEAEAVLQRLMPGDPSADALAASLRGMS